MGGLFNITDPVLGITLYLWSWVFFLILIPIVWAMFHFMKWKPLAPMHGLFYAQKNGSTVAWTFDAFLAGDLVSERDAKCIFDYSDHNFLKIGLSLATDKNFDGDAYEIGVPNVPFVKGILTWLYVKMFYYPTVYLDNITPLQAIVYKIGRVNKDVEIARKLEGGVWERSAAVVCAGVPVDIVVDMDKWTIKGSSQHNAVVRLALEWNEKNPTDQIHSYQKFQRYVDDNLIPRVRELTIESIIPWQRIDAAFPLDLDKNEWAGKIRQMAKVQEEGEQMQLNKFALYILVGGLLLAVVILLMRFALLAMQYSKAAV